MALPEELAELRGSVDQQLRRYCDFGAGCPPRLADAIRHSLLAPGKRLRPLLVLMAAEACGCAPRQAMPAACAVEMVHTYSLIHDDLPAMDDDDLRRGRPTCHRVYGEATAILAGDALLAGAFEALASGLDGSVAASCCAALAQAAGATQLVGGQADDLDAEFADRAEGVERVLERLESIHHRKTGAMLRVSLRLGALVARADAPRLQALDAYGRSLGLAFQIVDDLLDLEGDEQALGKRARKDGGRGKLTFPAVLGPAASRRRAEQLIDEACAALRPFESQASRLEALARYVLQRKH